MLVLMVLISELDLDSCRVFVARLRERHNTSTVLRRLLVVFACFLFCWSCSWLTEMSKRELLGVVRVGFFRPDALSSNQRCQSTEGKTTVLQIEMARPIFGSRPSDHYFRSVCLSVCLFLQFFSAVFDPIWIKLGHILHVRV